MTGLLLPLTLAFAAAAAVPTLCRRLRPALAARLLALTIGALLVATWATAVAVSLAYVAHQPLLGDSLQWCHDALGVHHSPPTLVGLASLAATALLSHRMITVARMWRRDAGTDGDHIHVVDSDRPLAYAQPGQRGGIVITTAMFDVLSPAERRAVLAHERAHLRHRHDRYLALAATIDTPPTRPLTRYLRAALERWADEDAATSTGDRTTVATAIARAALAATPEPAHTLAATGGDVPGRVSALLHPPAVATRYDIAAAAVATVIVAVTATQLHHLIAVIDTLCHQ
ncbi:MAG: M56 family metallopeptidase [Ilumatobacteraceae bacterium]